jgi:hypothetical protein
MRVFLICLLLTLGSKITLAQAAAEVDTLHRSVNYLKRAGNTMIGGSIAIIAGTIGIIDATKVSNVKIRRVMGYGSYGLYGAAGVLFILAGNDLVKASRQFENKRISFQVTGDGIGLALSF